MKHKLSGTGDVWMMTTAAQMAKKAPKPKTATVAVAEARQAPRLLMLDANI